MEQLDTNYIDKFTLLEVDYNKFYKTPVDKVKLIIIYINENREIYNIKSDLEQLEDGNLTVERLVFLIKKHQFNLLNKHRLVDLLKYNIDIESSDIKELALNTFNDKTNENFLTSLKIIDDIKFNDTIKMLHNENSLIFIFTNTPNKNINTKRIKFKSPQKKTRRKRA